MYKPLQKKNSSWTPRTAQKKSKSPSKLGHFSIQPKPNQKSSHLPEIGEYSRDSADRLAANVMRSLEAKGSQETETPTVQPQSESRISVADVVGQRMPTVMARPLTPQVSMASEVVPENPIQRQCADCASPQQEQSTTAGKDVEQISSEAGTIQTKLTVGAPGDPYEQEADRVAAQVVSMSAPPDNSAPVQRLAKENNPIQRGSLAQSITPVVQRRLSEQVQTQGLVQRAFQAGGTEASEDLESRLNASKGGGSPLSEEVRTFMEPRFGSDFSGVRVHTGSEAVQMNRELGAQAFTHGQDIFFNQGKYNPGSTDGKLLLAHEMTHVVQQTGGVQPKRTISESGERHEVGADQMEEQSKGITVPLSWQPIERISTGELQVQRYFLAQNPNDPSDITRVSDDRSVAVKQEGYGSHKLWAAPGKAQHSSNQLRAVNSVIELVENKTDVIRVHDLNNNRKNLVRVIPRNISNGTQGNGMIIWADCGRSARDVIGGENGTRGVYRDPASRTGQHKRTVETFDPEVIKWKVLENILRVYEQQLGQNLLDERRISRMKSRGYISALANYLLRIYNQLSPRTRENLDRRTGINRWANPVVGQAYTISSGGSPMRDINGNPIRTWNFHWAGVVMKSDNGRDNVTLENYSVSDYDEANTNWIFQMYGLAQSAAEDSSKQGQTFHEEHRDTGQHGETPTTLVVESNSR